MSWRNRTYVLLDVVQATIVWHKGSNLLPVLHQLDTSALTDSRVRLLSLNVAANETK
jgi:trans-aconitate methyltransferase